MKVGFAQSGLLAVEVVEAFGQHKCQIVVITVDNVSPFEFFNFILILVALPSLFDNPALQIHQNILIIEGYGKIPLGSAEVFDVSQGIKVMTNWLEFQHFLAVVKNLPGLSASLYFVELHLKGNQADCQKIGGCVEGTKRHFFYGLLPLCEFLVHALAVMLKLLQTFQIDENIGGLVVFDSNNNNTSMSTLSIVAASSEPFGSKRVLDFRFVIDPRFVLIHIKELEFSSNVEKSDEVLVFMEEERVLLIDCAFV